MTAYHKIAINKTTPYIKLYNKF